MTPHKFQVKPFVTCSSVAFAQFLLTHVETGTIRQMLTEIGYPSSGNKGKLISRMRTACREKNVAFNIEITPTFIT